MIIVFLGLPASGKGTQSRLIAERFGFIHISVGDLLRQVAYKKDPTDHELKIRAMLEEGSFVPDDVTNQLVFDVLEKNITKTCILDGYPRNITQANFLLKYSDNILVFYFNIPDELAIKRLAGRFMCNNCNAIYNKFFNNLTSDKCISCGSTSFSTRADDREEIVIQRLKEYKRSTQPLIDIFKAKNMLYEIDASESIKEVEDRICLMLKKH